MNLTALAPILAIVLGGAAALPAAASTDGNSSASTAPPAAVIVDDDGQQCPGADFASVQAAVQAASAGAVVRVCPGVYTEFVHIGKPLTLLGQVGAVATYDCFGQSAPQTGDLNPTRYAILNRPENTPGNLVTVAAGGVTVAGLVLQGATTPDGTGVIVDAAVDLQSASAGARVHHNLIRLSSLGIDLGSNGSATTRVDHNCLRGDPTKRTWGMASQRQDFIGGVVDHNETFQHRFFGYGVGDVASTRESVFAENVSRQDGRNGAAFIVTNKGSNNSIANNDIEPAVTGILSQGGSTNLSITGNRIAGGTQVGVAFSPSALGPAQDAVVAGNEISNFGSFGISVGTNALGAAAVEGVTISENVLSHNNFGVSVQLVNPGIHVLRNTATDNRTYGIRAARTLVGIPVPGALFRDNTMLRNGSAPFETSGDAFDANFSENIWVGNVCEHDNQMGAICGTS